MGIIVTLFKLISMYCYNVLGFLQVEIRLNMTQVYEVTVDLECLQRVFVVPFVQKKMQFYLVENSLN